jgi:hypothetical protein
MVLVGGSAFALANGKQLKDVTRLSQEDQFTLDDMSIIDVGLASPGNVVYAASFYTGAGDSLVLFHPWLKRDGLDCEEDARDYGDVINNFIGFLADGRYYLLGAPKTFEIRALCVPKSLVSFYFGETSRLSASIATALLRRTIVVKNDERGTLLQLRDGPLLRTDTAKGTATGFVLVAKGTPIVGPRDLTFAAGDLATLSRDGRWLATATSDSLAVWDTKTGTAVMEPRGLSKKPLDLQFGEDGEILRVVFDDATVRRYTVAVLSRNRPAWLEGLGEALTGHAAAEDGAIARIDGEQLRAVRAQVGTRLKAAAAADPAAAYLWHRFRW